jgi:hypothetical protein
LVTIWEKEHIFEYWYNIEEKSPAGKNFLSKRAETEKPFQKTFGNPRLQSLPGHPYG